MLYMGEWEKTNSPLNHICVNIITIIWYECRYDVYKIFYHTTNMRFYM